MKYRDIYRSIKTKHRGALIVSGILLLIISLVLILGFGLTASRSDLAINFQKIEVETNDIARDESGYYYSVDSESGDIMKLNPDGQVINTLNSEDTSAVYSAVQYVDGQIIVADTENEKIVGNVGSENSWEAEIENFVPEFIIPSLQNTIILINKEVTKLAELSNDGDILNYIEGREIVNAEIKRMDIKRDAAGNFYTENSDYTEIIRFRQRLEKASYKAKNLNGLAIVQSGLTGLNLSTIAEGFTLENPSISIVDVNNNLLAKIGTSSSSEYADWSNVSGGTSKSLGKSFMHNLVSAPGTSSSYTLYIPKAEGETSVMICPEATDLSEVTESCPNGVVFSEGSSSEINGVEVNVSVFNHEGDEYWAAEGVTGTGGISLNQGNASTDLRFTNPASGEVDTNLPNLLQFAYTPDVEYSQDDSITITVSPAMNADFINCTGGNLTTDIDGDGAGETVGDVGFSSFSTDANSSYATYVLDSAGTSQASTNGVSMCLVLPGGLPQGSYSFAVTDTVGNYGAIMLYANGDNDVFVTATVAPTLSFNIRNLADTEDTNECDLGSLTTVTQPVLDTDADDPGECGYGLAVGTNAANGYTVTINSDGALSSASHDMTPVANAGGFTANTEAYGIQNIIVSTTDDDPLVPGIAQDDSPELIGNFLTNSTPVPVAPVIMFQHNGSKYYSDSDGFSTDLTKVFHAATISTGTPTGSYLQTVTYTVTATF